MSTARRKTIPLEDLRIVTNRTIFAAKTREERQTAAHIWTTVSLNWHTAYRGFMYVDADGTSIPTETVLTGNYDESRRYYF